MNDPTPRVRLRLVSGIRRDGLRRALMLATYPAVLAGNLAWISLLVLSSLAVRLVFEPYWLAKSAAECWNKPREP